MDTGLGCFVLLAKYLRVSADPAQLLHDRGRGAALFEIQDILRAAKALGINARTRAVPADRLARQPLPAIARGTDGRFFILAKVQESDGELKVLIQRPNGDADGARDGRSRGGGRACVHPRAS